MAVDIPRAILERPLAAVRESCAALCEQAQSVRIDTAALGRLADAVDPREIRAAGSALAAELGALGALGAAGVAGATGAPSGTGEADSEALASFVLALDAINFGSGWFPHLAKLPGHSGYRTIEAHTSRWWREARPGAAELAEVTATDLARRLGQLHGARSPVGELLELFARSLRDLGALVQSDFAGSFHALVESARGSAEALVRTLLTMPLYRDIHRCGPHTVVLLKRAQISAADAARALGERLGAWRDLDGLTLFADNLVPHVLRLDGALEFDRDLVERIEREELLGAGSREELEIRASGVVAVEQMVGRLRARGVDARAMDVDAWLWTRGAGRRYKARPRHRARCAWY